MSFRHAIGSIGWVALVAVSGLAVLALSVLMVIGVDSTLKAILAAGLVVYLVAIWANLAVLVYNKLYWRWLAYQIKKDLV